MKKLVFSLLTLFTALSISSVVMAEGTTPEISKYTYDYQNNKISSNDNSTMNNSDQLSVLLIKADEQGNKPSTIRPENIYYVDQKSSGTLDTFTDLGVKGSLPAGTYYMVFGGDKSTEAVSEKVVVGNVDVIDNLPQSLQSHQNDMTFGSVSNIVSTFDGINDFTYAFVAGLNVNNAGETGVIYQYVSGTTVYRLYQTFVVSESVSNINATTKFGFQINNISKDCTQFSAIPYASTVSSVTVQ